MIEVGGIHDGDTDGGYFCRNRRLGPGALAVDRKLKIKHARYTRTTMNAQGKIFCFVEISFVEIGDSA